MLVYILLKWFTKVLFLVDITNGQGLQRTRGSVEDLAAQGI